MLALPPAQELLQIEELLLKRLSRSAEPGALRWLAEVLSAQRDRFERRPFYYAFSGVSRHFNRQSRPDADAAVEAALAEAAPGCDFADWDEFRLARVALLLVLADQEEDERLETVSALLNTADFREQAALYSALPFFPAHPSLVEAAIDGLRSNIVDVFDSIALGNPFPATRFPDEAWNQMVLKAIFIDRPLYRIVGLDSRRNDSLAEAVVELARERWAAGRQLTPEAWRNLAGHLEDRFAGEIETIVASERPEDRAAAALLLSGAPGGTPGAFAQPRERLAAEMARIESGQLDWDVLGKALG